MKKYRYVFVILLLSVMFLLGLFSLMGDSGTTDEVAHIPAGYSYWKFQDYRLNPEHPPLVKALATFPLLFFKNSPATGAGQVKFPVNHICWTKDVNGQWECGWEFIYRLGNNADKILLWTRLPILLLGLLLGLFVYRWSAELWGWKVGLIALFLYCLEPNILAHSRLVTTDLGATALFFIAMYYFYRFIKEPQGWWLWASGISFGLAQLCKFSNILLAIYMLLLILVLMFFWKPAKEIMFLGFNKFKKKWLGRIWLFLVSYVLICVIGFLIVGAVYAFFMWKMPVDKIHQTINESIKQTDNLSIKEKAVLNWMADKSYLKPYAYYGLGLKMVMARVSGGNTTYFLGKTSNQSWWYFYPVSFLIKTPIVLQILLVVALVFLIIKLKVKSKKLKEELKMQNNANGFKLFWEVICRLFNDGLFFFIALTCMAMFMFVGIYGNLNIGLRHILGMWPFMIMMAAWALSNLISNKSNTSRMRFKWLRISFGMFLISWYIVMQVMTYPHYLAYYNEFVGGYKNGWKYSVDSNTDWGQDLKRLAAYVDENNIKKIKVDYFGGSQPTYYMDGKAELWRSSFGETSGWLAVSATYYQNSKFYSKNLGEKDYSWLAKYEPVEVVGGSILVFEIK